MMPSLSLVDLAHSYGGVLWQLDGELDLNSVAIDSRKLEAGDCFVAIRGEKFDAHAFIDDVIHRGAKALVVEAPQQKKIPQWVVSDSTIALGQIAKENRQLFKNPLIAITGSNGKTTVKEMLASILRQCGPVLATEGNLNNHIGVPLTLLKLEAEHEYAVIEMGASALGEIAYSCSLAEPDVAVINNVGEAHIEKFGSAENIRTAKGEIYTGLKKGGVAVVNLESVGANAYIRGLKDCMCLTFGLNSPDADIRPSNIRLEDRYSSFELWIDGRSAPTNIQVPGIHNVANAVAAAACAAALSIPLDQIARGLEKFGGVSRRLEFVSGAKGSQLIDDSYNASPASVIAAMECLSNQPGQRIIVLGDMAELGEDAAQIHRQMGTTAKRLGIDGLWVVGRFSALAADAFGSGGRVFDSQSDLIEYAKKSADERMTLLVKGSRSANMDVVVDRLRTDAGEY